MNFENPRDKGNIKYRLREEMRAYATISLYLWVCFSVLLLYETAVLRAGNITEPLSIHPNCEVSQNLTPLA